MSHKRKNVNNYESEEVGVRKEVKVLVMVGVCNITPLLCQVILNKYFIIWFILQTFLYSFHLLLMINFVYKKYWLELSMQQR